MYFANSPCCTRNYDVNIYIDVYSMCMYTIDVFSVQEFGHEAGYNDRESDFFH